MRQDSEAKNCFFVNAGERIEITFEASKVPVEPLADKDRVHMAEGGRMVSKNASPTKRVVTFRLDANKPAGKSHTVLYECVFFTKLDPLGAKYIIFAASGGSRFRAGAASQLLPSGELWFTVE